MFKAPSHEEGETGGMEQAESMEADLIEDLKRRVRQLENESYRVRALLRGAAAVLSDPMLMEVPDPLDIS